METRTSAGLIDSLLGRAQSVQKLRDQLKDIQNPQAGAPETQNAQGRDLIVLSTQNPTQNDGSRLVTQTQDNLPNSSRVIENFQTADDRNFSRVTTVSETNSGFVRDVVQQNPSGSITRFEETLTRQDNGLFQRALRFTDASGNFETRIENNVAPRDPFIVSRLIANEAQNQISNQNEQQPLRGSQLDIQA